MKLPHYHWAVVFLDLKLCFRQAWLQHTGRWFPFRDVPDWMVQRWAIFASFEEDDDSESCKEIFMLAKEEWQLRKKKRNQARQVRHN